MDVYYVNDLPKREPGEIRYLRSYILARLYEAKNPSDTYYARWVEHDMNSKVILLSPVIIRCFMPCV